MVFLPKGIPREIQDEVKAINKFTKQTGREASLTICQKPGSDRVIVANNTKGTTDSSWPGACETERYGKLQRVMDFHTHPTSEDAIGITPSDSDFYSTLVDSYVSRLPQISCVTSPETPLNECYRPKAIPDVRKLNNYERALQFSQEGEPGWFVDNIPLDFDIQFFERDSGRYVPKPAPKEVVRAAFGRSRRDLQNKMNEFEHGGFCTYIQAKTVPNDDRIHDSCRAELRKRNILGVIEY